MAQTATIYNFEIALSQGWKSVQLVSFEPLYRLDLTP